ncbi:MAG: hypothetical protein LBE31_03995, partial [Deltaproteobacteria bacterium]|nr:hypothetical protein [Deltaproteobacteria bacterium]
MKRLPKISYLIILLLILSIASCNDSQPKEAAKPAETTAATAQAEPIVSESLNNPPKASLPDPNQPTFGNLEVLQFLPDGPTTRLSQIAVMFNQPMVGLGEYDLVNQDLLILEPPLEGTLRWLNQYTLAFIPEKIYYGSLNIKATLKAGLKSLSGQTLNEGRTITITLPSVKATQDYYYSGSTPESFLSPTFKITFNQKIVLSSFENRAFFVNSSDQPEFKIPASIAPYEYQYDDFLLTCLASPTSPLPLNSQYDLIIEPGLISEAGPEPTDFTIKVLSKNTNSQLNITIDSDLSVLGEAIPLKFGSYVKLLDVISYINIEPPVSKFENLKKRAKELEEIVKNSQDPDK